MAGGMWDAEVVIMYTSKGDRSDCNNNHMVSLLSIIGNAYAIFVLNILQLLAERIYLGVGVKYRAARSTRCLS